MSNKPLLILDQHFRTRDELFSSETFDALSGICEIVGGEDGPMDPSILNSLLPRAQILVAARPALGAEQIARACDLKAIIEVSGAFHSGLDYDACFERGIEVLSCAPGFGPAVAEMGLAMILAAGRGLVAEHEAFRAGSERWLDDRVETDFSLFRQKVGFVGYGGIARRLHDLMRPFSPSVLAYDPWLKDAPRDVDLVNLRSLFRESRVVVVTAVPTAENFHMISRDLVDALAPGAALVLLSRAHLVDFDAAVQAADDGRITFATDVFPFEPMSGEALVRTARNVILSPHRAAAVPGGRQMIGDMILQDIRAILTARPERSLLAADPNRVASLTEAQESMKKNSAPDWRV